MITLKASNANYPALDYHLSLAEQKSLLDIQYRILRMVANSEPQNEVFTALCTMAEALLPNSVASIMMLQPHGGMDVICAPSIPSEAQEKLNGLTPGKNAGSCGNAVFRNQPTFVINALIDERCLETRSVFKEYGLYSCWSTPIGGEKGQPIGSFALSLFEQREPDEFHKQLLAIGAYIIEIIFQRSEQQQQLEYMAYNDALTGLANRTTLLNKIENAISSDSLFSLLYLDLDRFKNLNDSFGHTVGDYVLQEITGRLKNSCEYGVTLARVGGDEFVALLDHEIINSGADEIAHKILDVLREAITYRQYNFKLDGSIGIVSYPRDGRDAVTLLKNADVAMYHSKAKGSNLISKYEPELSEKAEMAFSIRNDIHDALLNDEFKLVYQTQVDGKTREITGMEALIRWNSPVKGTISPVDFIPIAEQTGDIIIIGEWVVKTALHEVEPYFFKQKTPFTLSINISGVQLMNGHIDKLLEIINSSSIPNEYIELEITETFLVQEAESAANQLNKIRSAGIKLAIDDFGIGYSSLAYLKRFKVNTLKIDRLLINDIIFDADDLAITKAVIVMGHSLGLRVIAEGVETLEQANCLTEMGCDVFQGYYFSKPTALTAIKQIN